MRAVAWAMALLPWSWLAPLGSMVGLLAGSLLRVRRRHVEASLREAGLDPRLAPGVYASLGAGLCELLWLAAKPPEALESRFTMAPEAGEALDRALARGRGVVVATAHTGNWDLNACAAARWLEAHGHRKLTVVTKRLSWRALDRYWQRLRAERGVRLVDALGAATEVRDALAEGGVVALLVDQAPERTSGVAMFPFLGKPARHDLAPALLAARAKVPVVVLFGRRDEHGLHRLELCEEIAPDDLRARGGAQAATERIAAALEGFVRAHAEQWLWLHRRWK